MMANARTAATSNAGDKVVCVCEEYVAIARKDFKASNKLGTAVCEETLTSRSGTASC